MTSPSISQPSAGPEAIPEDAHRLVTFEVAEVAYAAYEAATPPDFRYSAVALRKAVEAAVARILADRAARASAGPSLSQEALYTHPSPDTQRQAVVEECAKVADARAAKFDVRANVTHGGAHYATLRESATVSRSIAAAIRALAKGSQDGTDA